MSIWERKKVLHTKQLNVIVDVVSTTEHVHQTPYSTKRLAHA